MVADESPRQFVGCRTVPRLLCDLVLWHPALGSYRSVMWSKGAWDIPALVGGGAGWARSYWSCQAAIVKISAAAATSSWTAPANGCAERRKMKATTSTPNVNPPSQRIGTQSIGGAAVCSSAPPHPRMTDASPSRKATGISMSNTIRLMQPPANPSPRESEGFPGRQSFPGKRGIRELGSKGMVPRSYVTPGAAPRLTRPRPSRGRAEHPAGVWALPDHRPYRLGTLVIYRARAVDGCEADRRLVLWSTARRPRRQGRRWRARRRGCRSRRGVLRGWRR